MNDDRKIICLIDDNEQYLNALAMPLMRSYQTHQFLNAHAFFEALDGGLSPDVVMTDYMIPEVSGAQLAARLRQIDSTIPVVLVSGYLTKTVAVEALNSGVSDLLEKPVEFKTLMQSIETALTRRRLFLVQSERRKTEKLYVDTLTRLSQRLEERLVQAENKLYELEKFVHFHEIANTEEVQRTVNLLMDGIKLPSELKDLEQKFQDLELEESDLQARLLAQQPLQGPTPMGSRMKQKDIKEDN